MSVGSELLSVLINIIIVLVVGGMLYEFINWGIRNVIVPISDLNAQLGKIPDLLTKYAKAFSDTGDDHLENTSIIANETKMVATKVITGRDTIPVYNFFAKVGIVNSYQVIDDIVRSLNFLAAALFEVDPSISTIKMVQNKIMRLEEALGVEKHSSRRIKITKKPKEEAEDAVES